MRSQHIALWWREKVGTAIWLEGGEEEQDHSTLDTILLCFFASFKQLDVKKYTELCLDI